MRRISLTLVGLFSLAASSAQANEYFALQTSITGAQTQIDTNHTSTWAFTTGLAWDFGGGTFVMKRGSNSSAPVVLSIYEGTNFTGTLVGSFSLGSSAITQSFADVQFLFGSPLTLHENGKYYVDLTSTANDTANVQYFIKGSNSSLSFVDSNGDPIPMDYVTSVTDASGNTTQGVPTVPEPVSMSLMVVALGGLGLARGLRRDSRGTRSSFGC